MEVFSGRSVFEGIAIGKIYLFQKSGHELQRWQVENTAAEAERFTASCKEAKAQLEKLYQVALSQAGEEQAQIFDVHKMMLEDEDYLEAVHKHIQEQKTNAEYAVYSAGEHFAALFSQMEDAYMKARACDVLDVSNRLIGILSGADERHIEAKEPVILLAEDLTPSETVQLDKSKILAIVTTKGSANSHTAILARSMSIPALVGTDILLLREYDGRSAVVDGFSGTFVIDPDAETAEKMERKRLECERESKALKALIGAENVTRDGRRIQLFANIGEPADVEKVLEADAGGIGLFRSEFLYLGRADFPSEEEQFLIYKDVLSRMGAKKVIIRTLDIGADKKVGYFHLPEEENPAMGYRAIRICLDRVSIFKTQLRAILRASVYGNAAIMFPMIISVNEICRVKEIVEEVKKELRSERFPFAKVELGIMVETPAAVMISEELAREVDFFSIGTNDLTQYTLAIDRQNQNLESFYAPHHPAVLRMIKMTVENGHKAGIWVGICGELAADMSLTGMFLDMGVDELSVSPAYVLGLRKVIREL